jgi:hypothetical protein
MAPARRTEQILASKLVERAQQVTLIPQPAGIPAMTAAR